VLKRKFFGELTMMYRKSSMAQEQLDLFFNTELSTTHRPLIDKQMAMITWQQQHTPGYLGAQLSLFRHFPLSGMADLYAVSGRRTERPVLFLWGNDDNLFPLRKALSVVENAFPAAEILSLIECGHNPIFEKFEDVAPAVLEFYRQQDA
jgi:pimeloyl-ACP methyl ester carboxylesterase